MTVLITLTIAGTDTGPFNLYSNVDGFTSAFETGVPKASLVAGYTSFLVPDGTTVIRVMSDSASCKNYIDIPVGGAPTTTTTTTTGAPVYYTYEAEQRECTDCGYNVGTVIVQSTTPITLFTYAVPFPIPTPVTTVYKVIATSILPATVTVVPAGPTCIIACAAIPE